LGPTLIAWQSNGKGIKGTWTDYNLGWFP